MKPKTMKATTTETTETTETPRLLSREVIHHPDGSVETIERFEAPGDWREAARELERLLPDVFGPRPRRRRRS